MLENVGIAEKLCNLQRWRQSGDLASARDVYLQICKKGLEALSVFPDRLLSALAHCNSMLDASYVFQRFGCCRNERSWTRLIQGSTDCGDPAHALMLFRRNSQEDWCIKPSKYTFVALLKACSKLRCAEAGRDLHAQAILGGFDADPFVGNTIVGMHAKCGMILDARHVFRKLPSRNAASWNALLTGFIEHGHGLDALNLSEQMESEGMPPDAITFSCGLKACTLLGDVDSGRKMHTQIVCKGVERGASQSLDVNLVEMYVKCGSFVEARSVLDHAPSDSTLILWTILILGYIEFGLSEEALQNLNKIHECGVSPDEAAFVCILKACSALESIEEGRLIHAEVVVLGMERSIVLCNTLLDLYTKCGCFREARHTFETMRTRTVVTWNVLIAGNTEHGHDKDALDCFDRMLRAGVLPDSNTFGCCLKAYRSSGMIAEGRRMHSRVIKEGLEADQVLGNVLVDMYAKYGSLLDARDVFDKLPVQNSVSWNTIISGYIEHEHPVEAFNCLEEMQSEGIQSDATTSLYFLKSCGSLESSQKGQAKHIEIVKQGLEREPLISNSLVDMYAKCGHLRDAQELSRCTQGDNAVLCGTLLAAYVDHGYAEEALECLNQMSMSKNTVTYICVLKACSAIGAIDIGRVMHSEIIKAGVEDASLCRSGNKLCNKTETVNPQVEAADIVLGNALIDMYGKCGSLPDAYNLAIMAPFADIVSWNAIVTGYARQGQSGSVFCVLDKMIRKGMEPDQVTFLGILSACSHDGLVDIIHSYFEAVESTHGSIRPGIAHFNCMLDAFARAGQFNEAVLMMRNMPHQPNLSSWCCILGACCKWGNLELGRYAFECASKLTKCHASLFIVMANIYWDAPTLEQSQTIELILLQSSTVLEHG